MPTKSVECLKQIQTGTYLQINANECRLQYGIAVCATQLQLLMLLLICVANKSIQNKQNKHNLETTRTPTNTNECHSPHGVGVWAQHTATNASRSATLIILDV